MIAFVFFVSRQHFAVIHFIYVVAGNNKKIRGVIASYKSPVLVNGVRGSAVPVGSVAAAERRQKKHASRHTVQIPRMPLVNIVVQKHRQVLGKDPDGIDPGVDAI